MLRFTLSRAAAGASPPPRGKRAHAPSAGAGICERSRNCGSRASPATATAPPGRFVPSIRARRRIAQATVLEVASAPGLQDRRRRPRALRESGAARCRLRLPGIAGECAIAKENPGCSSAGIRADEGHPGNMDQLADLLKPISDSPRAKDRGHRLADGRPRAPSALARKLVCDAELREQRGRQIGAAAAVRVRRATSPQATCSGRPRRWRCPASRPRSAPHADQRAGEIDLAAARTSLACRARRRPLHRGSRHRGLAARETRGNRLRRVAHRWAARREQAVAARRARKPGPARIDP